MGREERQQRAGKVSKWLGHDLTQVSAQDAGDGPTAQMREAPREIDQLRLMDELLAEQRETNRLLELLVERSSPSTTPEGRQSPL